MISAPLASPSIFDEDLASATSAPGDPSQPSSVKQPRKVPLPAPSTAAHPSSPLYRTAQRVLDPDPRSSALWLRRRVIAHVRSLTSPQPYKRVLPARVRAERSERSVVVSSEPLPTSTKKLVHLARQIAGKRIDDAKLQMRLSKKKMARDVGAVLELARLRGIVGHGMGLGEAEKKRTDGATAATGDAPGQASAEAAADDSGSAVATTAAATVPALAQPRLQPKIQLKSGNWVSVPDPTAMYVAQAWVGRAGWRGMRVNHHGRGRMTQMWRPLTSTSSLIKFNL